MAVMDLMIIFHSRLGPGVCICLAQFIASCSIRVWAGIVHFGSTRPMFAGVGWLMTCGPGWRLWGNQAPVHTQDHRNRSKNGANML